MSNQLTDLIEDLNVGYDKVHFEKEELFWRTKMGLSDDFESYNIAEGRLNEFRQDSSKLEACREAIKVMEGRDKETLKGWIAFFEANLIENDEAKCINETIIELESQLALARKEMDLGYHCPNSGKHVSASSVALSLSMAGDDDSEKRKASFYGLASIEQFVLENGFLDIVKARNSMARSLGYDDFYAYKLKITEQLTMTELFHWMDDLEEKTRDAAKDYVESVRQEYGADAIKPWSFSYHVQGESMKEIDPYLSFADSVMRWGKSFSAMNIGFENAELNLDLIDRKGKYENGFCHAPVVAYVKKDGTHIDSVVNFTSNAIPHQKGSGMRALNTLLHEGGHAAHFANISMGAPCFSQEFAPTSVAMAEMQSMFLDALLSDSDWLHRYAGVPWEVIERRITQTHPSRVRAVRQMLLVPFFERELYGLKDDEMTSERILQIARDVEKRMTFMERSPRPLLSIPHLLESESSAYYHGYILADCAVEQTREYFFHKYGHIVDNPKVGPELKEKYWALGNSLPFIDFVKKMTGRPFSVDSLVKSVCQTTKEAVVEQKKRFDFLKKIPEVNKPVDMNVLVNLVHGDEIISSMKGKSFEEAAEAFKIWVEKKYS